MMPGGAARHESDLRMLKGQEFSAKLGSQRTGRSMTHYLATAPPLSSKPMTARSITFPTPRSSTIQSSIAAPRDRRGSTSKLKCTRCSPTSGLPSDMRRTVVSVAGVLGRPAPLLTLHRDRPRPCHRAHSRLASPECRRTDRRRKRPRSARHGTRRRGARGHHRHATSTPAPHTAASALRPTHRARPSSFE